MRFFVLRCDCSESEHPGVQLCRSRRSFRGWQC
jgi:hypothetical protein